MIYVFGDSHARFNMNRFTIPHTNLCENSITMFRIGRDQHIINFSNTYNNSDNIFILFYGEVDCRCHIGKQILLGRELNEIVENLVSQYFNTIKNNITLYKQIIIGSITPPMCREKYESVYGPITHEFPFIGTDDERILYTQLMNNKIREYCNNYKYIFLDTYNYYSDNGLLHFDKSDAICHIIDNKYIHDKIISYI